MNSLENRVIDLIEKDVSVVLSLLQDLDEYTARHIPDIDDKCHVMTGFYERTEKIKNKIVNSLSCDLTSLKKNVTI